MTLFNMLVTAVGSTAKFAEERLYGFVDLLFAIESDRSSTYSSSSATASQGSRPRSVLRSTTRSHLHSSKKRVHRHRPLFWRLSRSIRKRLPGGRVAVEIERQRAREAAYQKQKAEGTRPTVTFNLSPESSPIRSSSQGDDSQRIESLMSELNQLKAQIQVLQTNAAVASGAQPPSTVGHEAPAGGDLASAMAAMGSIKSTGPVNPAPAPPPPPPPPPQATTALSGIVTHRSGTTEGGLASALKSTSLRPVEGQRRSPGGTPIPARGRARPGAAQPNTTAALLAEYLAKKFPKPIDAGDDTPPASPNGRTVYGIGNGFDSDDDSVSGRPSKRSSYGAGDVSFSSITPSRPARLSDLSARSFTGSAATKLSFTSEALSSTSPGRSSTASANSAKSWPLVDPPSLPAPPPPAPPLPNSNNTVQKPAGAAGGAAPPPPPPLPTNTNSASTKPLNPRAALMAQIAGGRSALKKSSAPSNPSSSSSSSSSSSNENSSSPKTGIAAAAAAAAARRAARLADGGPKQMREVADETQIDAKAQAAKSPMSGIAAAAAAAAMARSARLLAAGGEGEKPSSPAPAPKKAALPRAGGMDLMSELKAKMAKSAAAKSPPPPAVKAKRASLASSPGDKENDAENPTPRRRSSVYSTKKGRTSLATLEETDEVDPDAFADPIVSLAAKSNKQKRKRGARASATSVA